MYYIKYYLCVTKSKNMNTYQFFSAKQQGCYSKDELIYTLTEKQFKKEYFGCEVDKIVTDGNNKVYVKIKAN